MSSAGRHSVNPDGEASDDGDASESDSGSYPAGREENTIDLHMDAGSDEEM